MPNENPNLWALLVGINNYQSLAISTLRGCSNDVEAMRRFLINHLNVPESQILMLVDAQATREGMISAFKNFLINNPDLPPGSQMLFHFSGHGSQMRNTTGTEPDGMDETLVPHDSRTGEVVDIPDKTLAGLIDQLAATKGNHITVILDCCHSGSGTREPRPDGAAPTRRAPADDRLPPAHLDATIRAGAHSATRSGWSVIRSSHVLLAGCLDREESHEHDTPEGVVHGALTYFALEYLRQMPSPATYLDWHAYVKTQVSARYSKQTPQCEGQRDRAIFGGVYVERDPFVPVKQIQGNTVTFEAGLVHGVQAGAELALYPLTVTTRQNLPAPLATVKVQSVAATTAQAILENMPPGALPITVHGLVTQPAYAGIRQRVALMPGEGANNAPALSALRQAISGAGKSSPYLELLDDPQQPADLRVAAENGKFSIRDDAGNLLVTPQDFQQSGAVAVRQALESMARYRTILALANQQSSQLTGKITLRLRRCRGGAACTEVEDLPIASDGTLLLEYDPNFPDRNFYVVEVINASAREVYPHLFILSPDYSIGRLYPAEGQSEALAPKQTLSSGLHNSGGVPLQIYLPGDMPGEERWDMSHDRLKLIATTLPCNLEMLQQASLSVPAPTTSTRAGDSPLAQLLAAVTSGATTRAVSFGTKKIEDWATAELPYTVMRVSPAKTLGAAKGRMALGDGITLAKPPGFEGTITVAPLEQTWRCTTDGPSLKLPPGLSPDFFQPVTRAGTRGLAGQPLVITLETDEASRAVITPENPLRFHLPDHLAAEDLWPLAFDGEDYLPVGYAAEANVVDVVRVPRAIAETTTRRGMSQAIQLFIFKKVGKQIRQVGLRYVENKNGGAEYSAVQKDRFKPGHRVAVLVHGFLSDTRWMARDVAPFLRSQVLPYEHVLAWDYETFGASVEATGADLATALRQQCDCRANDELTVHVYAHGVGCLVSRCTVELAAGHEFVDRLILAGPPNRGTTLATFNRGFTYLLSALLNNLSAMPPAGAANWRMKELYEHGHGWKDLAVDSEITKRLNALAAPANVPYLVLAGANQINQVQGNRLDRLAHKMLEQTLQTVFGETENDAVIGMSSMKGLRHGTYPALTIAQLPCDHFSYFTSAEGQMAIRKWILN